MNEQIDELLSEYLASHQRANRLLARGNVDVGGCNALQVKARAKAKAKLQRLIVEARIDELGSVGAPNEAYDTICYTDNERGVITVKDRIAQLKKELEKHE